MRVVAVFSWRQIGGPSDWAAGSWPFTSGKRTILFPFYSLCSDIHEPQMLKKCVGLSVKYYQLTYMSGDLILRVLRREETLLSGLILMWRQLFSSMNIYRYLLNPFLSHHMTLRADLRAKTWFEKNLKSEGVWMQQSGNQEKEERGKEGRLKEQWRLREREGN